MRCSSRQELQSSTICGLCSVYAVELRPKLQIMQDTRSVDMFCTVLHAVQMQCNYKCTSTYEDGCKLTLPVLQKSLLTRPWHLGGRIPIYILVLVIF